MTAINDIICGDCIEVMRDIDSESVDCIVTSPPYGGLRDYGVEGQIGLEASLDEYHKRLLEVTAECKRVLKKTGTMFWVHGDSYGGSGQGAQTGYGDYKRKGVNGTMKKAVSLSATSKCLTMQNYRLSMRMIDEQGWILRNILIWHKNNYMPSSVQDRFTNAYEPVFFFTKSKKYWFDLNAIRVPQKEESKKKIVLAKKQKKCNSIKNKEMHNFNPTYRTTKDICENLDPEKGKNPGDVFTLSTQPFPEAHFAVFPEKLIEPFITAGCPCEVCKHCGFIRERTIKREVELEKGRNVIGLGPKTIQAKGDKTTLHHEIKRYTTGWTSCTCEDKNKYEPGIVLDPFMGAGTTAVVAKKLGRLYRCIEINPEYIEIARKRISKIPVRLDRFL